MRFTKFTENRKSFIIIYCEIRIYDSALRLTLGTVSHYTLSKTLLRLLKKKNNNK